MDKIKQRNRRKRSIRKKVVGNAERPRMSVHKSNRNIYVQIINDIEGKTLCGASTRLVEAKGKGKTSAITRKNVNFASVLGEEIAKTASGKGIKKIVFDRAGYQYHGAVKALADAARKNGLQF
ncbi:MAG: 50S ribosomal protein L18 [Candidatus Omnitrophota bacterium]